MRIRRLICRIRGHRWERRIQGYLCTRCIKFTDRLPELYP